MSGADWSDERVEALKKLWAEGLSASQIQARLGCVSRSAVIGKVHRLRLPPRVTTSRNYSRPRGTSMAKPRAPRIDRAPRPARASDAVFAAPAFEVEAMPVVAEIDIPESQKKTMAELEACHCRWPLGDPRDEGFRFCGGAKVPGLPYCEHHVRRAFVPSGRGRAPERPFIFGARPLAGTPRTAATDKPRETEDVS